VAGVVHALTQRDAGGTQQPVHHRAIRARPILTRVTGSGKASGTRRAGFACFDPTHCVSDRSASKMRYPCRYLQAEWVPLTRSTTHSSPKNPAWNGRLQPVAAQHPSVAMAVMTSIQNNPIRKYQTDGSSVIVSVNVV
jgi:hypothetical protein